jgi:uncharacterized membrane protein
MDINRLISLTLRIGVLASVALALLGVTLWFRGGSGSVNVASGSGVGSTILSAMQQNPSGLIYLGVAVLVATPIFRVGLTTVYFGHEKDGKYVLISLIVLSMLFLALFSGSTG